MLFESLARVVVCVGCFICRGVLWRTMRDVFLSLWMTALLTMDICKDFYADYWEVCKEVSVPVAVSGEVAVVTGGARGLGVHIVKRLLEGDMCVIVGCRRVEQGLETFEKIRKSGLTSGSLTIYELDLTSRSSVKVFADTVLRNHPQIHVLVNNAGITSPTRTLTEDGVETTFCVNYLSHFYLSHLLLGRLAESAAAIGRNARIVNVSSCVHHYPLLAHIHLADLTLSDNFQEYVAYGQSKLAQVMFTKTLDAKLRAAGLPVQVHAAHPGFVFTHLTSTNLFHTFVPWFFPCVLRTAEAGSRSVLYSCVSPDLESRGGTYVTSCGVVPAGSAVSVKHTRSQLWAVSKDLLHLSTFGGYLA